MHWGGGGVFRAIKCIWIAISYNFYSEMKKKDVRAQNKADARHRIHSNSVGMHVAFHSSRGYDCTLMVLSLKGPGFSQLLLRLVKKSEHSTALKKQMFVLKMKSHFHHRKSIRIMVLYVAFRQFLFPPFSCIFPI